MQRRDFLAATAGAFLGRGLLQAAPERKPNIIYILADDLGTPNVGCYGGDNVQTPQIDRLAREGMRFTNGYTAPLCGPSRALIMTGRYAFRTGATNQDATGRMQPSKETFMPSILKTAGYTSVCVGKWGQLPLGPAEFGFDEHFRFKGSGTYWNTQPRGQTYWINNKEIQLRDNEYIPDLMHNYMVDFMTRHREKPFYAYYSLSHIHGEILRTPDSKPGVKDFYDDNIRYMDKLVGKLMSELDRLKLRDNTLVVFMGDNGTAQNFADRSTIGGKRLSGEKGSMLEGGALVPLIVNWRGRTPAGKVCADMVDSTDFVPTFAELAGARLPSNTVIDGQSMVGRIRGEKAKPREWAYIQLANQYYVRETGWKLNQNGDLFDMSRAPFAEPKVEANASNPTAAAARKRLQAALDKLNPAAGIRDDGDGTGRHAGRNEKKKANRKKKQ